IMTFVPRTTSFHSISMLVISDSSSTYVQEKRFHSMSICFMVPPQKKSLMVEYLCSCRCYPFYYAPFASDFKCLSQFNISFTVDKPLRPFDQLMAVLPPQKNVLSCALPKCYSKLIGCEESKIQMSHPTEFEIDPDGRRFLSQGIAKLPFIDKELLLSATKMVEKDLTEDEMARNNARQERIFLRNSQSLANTAAFVATISDNAQKKLWIDTRCLNSELNLVKLSTLLRAIQN
uniref:Xrn1 helical domain-containing protein n=1 Tax=Aegilops tauschii subsp. strangulata TaxID=200361 RepID=A0A453LGI8_AEGTS